MPIAFDDPAEYDETGILFEENNGKIGTLMYIKYKWGVSFSDGRTLLRMAKTTDNVRLPDGTVVQTASRATVFAEMIRSMQRDGPRATLGPPWAKDHRIALAATIMAG